MTDHRHFPQIKMTSEQPWDPSASSYADNEDALCLNLSSERGQTPSRLMSSILWSPLDAHFNVHNRFSSTSFVSSTTSVRLKGTVSAESLSQRWYIGIETAGRTIERSTKHAVCDFSRTEGACRLKHMIYQLKYRHLLSGVDTDTLFAKTKSLQQNTCGQTFCTDFQWQAFYPLKTKKDSHLALDSLHKEYGVFHTLIPENS
jgi:hypothetical protein